MSVRSLSWEDLLEEGFTAHSSILACIIPMDRGAQQTTVHGLTKSQTRLKRLSTHTALYKINCNGATLDMGRSDKGKHILGHSRLVSKTDDPEKFQYINSVQIQHRNDLSMKSLSDLEMSLPSTMGQIGDEICLPNLGQMYGLEKL